MITKRDVEDLLADVMKEGALLERDEIAELVRERFGKNTGEDVVASKVDIAGLEAFLAECRLNALTKQHGIAAVAKAELGLGQSTMSEHAATQLWTEHAYAQRKALGLGETASPAQALAKLVAREPLVMRHIALAKQTGWAEVAKARQSASVNGMRAGATLIDRPVSLEPLQVGGSTATSTADTDSEPADAQRRQIIEEKGRAAPWMSAAELAAYADAMCRAVERANEGVRRKRAA
jgi:hypothetical protein